MKNVLLLLSLLLLALSVNAQSVALPNGDFENWNTGINDTPLNWHIHEYGQILRTTDKHSGNYAIELVSKYDTAGKVRWASVTLGLSSAQPGMPFTNIRDTLTGYYKCTGSDVGRAYIEVLKDRWAIGVDISYMFPPVDSYTYFEIPIWAPDTPDHLFVEFFSGDNGDGNALYLDDLKLKNPPTNIGNVANQEKGVIVYPNPASNTLYIESTSNSIDTLEVNIYSYMGMLMYSSHVEESSSQRFSIPVGNFPTGLYQYKVGKGGETIAGTFMKE